MLEQGPGSLAPAVTVPEPLPSLPVDVWVRILQLIFTEDLTPLKSLVRLQLVSRTVLEAVRSLPLATEVISEPALQSLRPLLQACPCASLSFHRSVDGESLLRHPGFRAMSGRTLTSLRAVVACTDTLSRFPALERLVLEAGAIRRFYPSVLHGGLRNLRSLSLVRFPEMELRGLDPVLLPSLRVGGLWGDGAPARTTQAWDHAVLHNRERTPAQHPPPRRRFTSRPARWPCAALSTWPCRPPSTSTAWCSTAPSPTSPAPPRRPWWTWRPVPWPGRWRPAASRPRR